MRGEAGDKNSSLMVSMLDVRRQVGGGRGDVGVGRAGERGLQLASGSLGDVCVGPAAAAGDGGGDGAGGRLRTARAAYCKMSEKLSSWKSSLWLVT